VALKKQDELNGFLVLFLRSKEPRRGGAFSAKRSNFRINIFLVDLIVRQSSLNN
jgi:hypothetical protein